MCFVWCRVACFPRCSLMLVVDRLMRVSSLCVSSCLLLVVCGLIFVV